MKKDYVHIAMVLDRSGSMMSCVEDTKGGFNSFIEEQKKLPGEATVTLAQFDDQYEIVYAARFIKMISPLEFNPRGSTALLDAIGRTINDTGKWLESKPEADRPEKVLFVIITDGEENASREFTWEKIFEMIRHQESVYQWQFVFIGANQDAIKAGASLGINVNAALTYDPQKIGSTYSVLDHQVRAFRAGGTSARVAFSNEDREATKPKEK